MRSAAPFGGGPTAVVPAGRLGERRSRYASTSSASVRRSPPAFAARPLHLRDYRVASRPGALHPPLARALALVAGDGAFLDPCCGTGTVAIEAALADPSRRVLGYDIDPGALAAACANARAARLPLPFAHADAAALPLRDASVDAAAANLPWERRVPASGLLRCGLEPLRVELLRVLRPGRRAALLVPPDAFPDVDHRTAIRVAGARASIIVLHRER